MGHKTLMSKYHSLEIWAVKLRFLLIYINMLKSIATARSGCTAKHKSKARYNTDHIVPDLIDFFSKYWKAIKTQIEKRNIYIYKNHLQTKNWFVVSNFWEFPKHDTEKCTGHLYFLIKTKVKFATFRTF